MYAPQTNLPTATKYFLDALNTGEAQLKTADGADTVFAQKMQQGITQGMPQARQDYANAAPSMMRNMQQQQMQRMIQQAMQPQPAGIEGLPAPNMQGMAEGGVVGFAGPEGSFVGGPPRIDVSGDIPIYAPREGKEAGETEAEYRARKAREAEEAQGERPIPRGLRWIQENILRPMSQAGGQRMAEMRGVPVTAPVVKHPRGQENYEPAPQVDFRDSRYRTMELRKGEEGVAEKIGTVPLDKKPKIQLLTSSPGLRTSAQPSAAPVTGIATTLPAQPTLAGAMGEVEKLMPGTGTEPNRAALEELQRMRRARPASGIGSLAALQEEARVMADLKSKEDASAQERGIMAWLAGRGGRGASAQSYMGYQQNEQQRQKLFAQENTIRAAKIDAINEANEARKVGDQEKYVEALNKLSELDRADKQVKAQLASNTMQTQAILRGQNMTAQTAADDRASLERRAAADRAAQAALRNLPSVEQQMAERVMKDYMAKNPGSTLSDAWDFYRGAGKPTDRAVLTFAQAAKIVDERLSEPQTAYALMNEEVAAAKKEGRQPRSRDQIREALIRRELQMAGGGGPAAAPAGGSAPAVGTIMQGYRFKGGNPADKNNWEKV